MQIAVKGNAGQKQKWRLLMVTERCERIFSERPAEDGFYRDDIAAYSVNLSGDRLAVAIRSNQDVDLNAVYGSLSDEISVK